MITRSDAAARLHQRIADRSAKTTSIGLGFIGTTITDALISAGFETHSYDRSPEVVARYAAKGPGHLPENARPWSVGLDEAVLDEADVVFIAVRGLIRPDRTLDLAPFRSVAESLKRHPHPEGRLLMMESTLPPGSTRVFGRDWLGMGAEDPVFLCHSPERLSVGHTWEDFRRIPHVVGGMDPESTALGTAILRALVNEVQPVSAPEVSELSKLLENAFMTVGISLIGEITRISHGLGVTADEVCRAAGTKPFGYFPFGPGPGVGGHCLPNDLQILRHTAGQLGWSSPLLDGVNALKDAMPGMAVDRLGGLMAAKGDALAGSRVLVIGVGFKVGSADLSETPATDIVRVLRERGAEPVYLDTRVDGFAVDGTPVARVGPEALTSGSFPGALILSGDAAVDAGALERAAGVVLDTGGGRILRGALSGAARL